jgi:hypothetical protein
LEIKLFELKKSENELNEYQRVGGVTRKSEGV